MRDRNAFSIARALPRMSWHPRNLYLMWLRTMGPKAADIDFRSTTQDLTLFAQRWRSKACVRAYHGDFIPEKIFKRWYLPETLPDVRPKRSVETGDDIAALEEFARRKKREIDWGKEEEKKGMAPVGSLMFTEVERRIDVFVFRCCFAHSVYEARRLVIHGYVKLNGRPHSDANTRLAPGDMVSVDPSAIRFLQPGRPQGYYDNVNKILAPETSTKLTPFYLPHYAAPWLFVPAYIEVNFNTCSAIYVRHPTARPGYSEIPTPYDADGEVVRFAWEWYVMRRPRIRSKAQLARMPLDRTYNPDEVNHNLEWKRKKERAARKKEATRGMLLSRRLYASFQYRQAEALDPYKL